MIYNDLECFFNICLTRLTIALIIGSKHLFNTKNKDSICVNAVKGIHILVLILNIRSIPAFYYLVNKI